MKKIKKLEKKQIISAILTVIMTSGIIAFSMVTHVKNGTIKQQAVTIDSLEYEIVIKDVKIKNLESVKAILVNGMDSILAENMSLKKDLATIEKKYAGALTKIKSLESKIRDKKDEIAHLQSKISEYEAMITRLQKTYGEDVQVFVNEKDELKKKLDVKQKEVNHLKNDKEGLKVENRRLVKEKTQTEKLLEINSIMAQTKVKIVEFIPKNSKNKTTKKVKGDNWNSSIFTILLQHNNKELLEGRRFAIKLYDADNEKILEYLEGSDNVRNESIREFEYNKDGNFVEFINYEKKIGKNYYLVLYLLDDSDPDRKFNELDDKPQLVNRGKPLTKGA